MRIVADADQHRERKIAGRVTEFAHLRRVEGAETGETLVHLGKMPPAAHAGPRRFQLDIETGPGLAAESGDLRKTRHVDTIESGKLRCRHFGNAAVDAEDALEMIVMRDDDHAVAGQLRVELPHLSAEFGGAAKGGKRVLGFMAAGATMADAKGKPALGRWPAVTLEKSRKIAGHQSLLPCSSKTNMPRLSIAQRTSSPTWISLRTGWMERSSGPPARATS